MDYGFLIFTSVAMVVIIVVDAAQKRRNHLGRK